MTEFERNLPLVNFENTGRKSYRMGVDLSNNPYEQDPWRDRWDKGWRMARKEDPANRFTRRQDEANQQTPRPRGHTKWKTRNNKPKPGLSDRQVNKFNNRHRTAVGG